MKKIDVVVGEPVVYYHDIDKDSVLDPFYFLIGEILEDGYLMLAPMARGSAPEGFKNPVPYSPVPTEGHWNHRYEE